MALFVSPWWPDEDLMLAIHAMVRNGYGFADVMDMGVDDLDDFMTVAEKYNRMIADATPI